MDFARSLLTGKRGVLNAPPVPAPFASITQPDFQYNPGFKLALGVETNYDSWSILTEYTWLHQSTRTTVGSVLPNSAWEDADLAT